MEEVPVPPVGPGELLLQVEACGICGTDLKKVFHGDLPPPRIFGHEVGGRIAQVGSGVTQWQPGDRALFFHHVPCRKCIYCQTQEYAQCPHYKKVGTTAGFEPAGGGWAEFVQIKDWIVQEGLIRIPEQVTAEEATFVEPMNTCLKAVQKAGALSGRSVLLFGAGPVGLMLLQLIQLEKGHLLVTDPIPERLELARKLGAERTHVTSASSVLEWSRKEVGPQGVDVALVATAAPEAIRTALAAVRPAGRVVLFAQTRLDDEVALDVGQIGRLEKTVVGSYSASVDLQQKAAELIFSRTVKVEPLISHRFALNRIEEALEVARTPSSTSLKVILTLGNGGAS